MTQFHVCYVTVGCRTVCPPIRPVDRQQTAACGWFAAGRWRNARSCRSISTASADAQQQNAGSVMLTVLRAEGGGSTQACITRRQVAGRIVDRRTESGTGFCMSDHPRSRVAASGPRKSLPITLSSFLVDQRPHVMQSRTLPTSDSADSAAS